HIAAAVDAGLVHGRNDGSFDAGANVTRVEASIMMARALKAAGLDVTPVGVSFSDSIPAWAAPEILAAARYHLVTGYPDGSFQGGKSLTRAEAATILARLQALGAQQ
ncbi:MAG: S-layer homology domain-containing protein, partial [Mycobacterium leprae]